MRIKIIIKTIFIAICIIISTQVPAETNTTNPNLYQVNIIIFEHITQEALNSEMWPTITDLPDLKDSIEPQLLPNENSQLQTENRRFSRKIAQENNYKILANLTWQQEIPVTRHAKPIHISGDKIDGTIAINRDRYFNIKSNLILTEPTSFLNTTNPENYPNTANNIFTSFQMKQTRRMRSNELNYIDYPLFGMLIKIMPIEQVSS
jgi:hypothetical protein